MEIDYKILWFEDNETFRRQTGKFIKRHLVRKGFGFEAKEEIDARNLETIKFNDYDLILMDYNLAPNEGSQQSDGSQIIKYIRERQLYTEMIFYSARDIKELRGIMAHAEVDGVFCVHRDELISELPKIVDVTIKKLEDVNNMRGLVLAETSSLEQRLLDLVKNFLHGDRSLADHREKFLKYLSKSLGDKIKDDQKKLERCKTGEQKFESHPLFAAEKRSRAIGEIIKLAKEESLPHSEMLPEPEKFKTLFCAEILKKRNLLAHAETEERNGQKILVSKLLGHEETFNDEYCRDLRLKLKDYGRDIQKLEQFIGICDT